jgi:1-acyl-sn-glycerol-3-phosphate acyltransferase
MTSSDPKLDDAKYALFTNLARWGNYFIIILSGYKNIEKKNLDHICYKKYLGEDWTPKWTGAPTLICNHRSWLDICIGYAYFNACFVGKTAVKSLPGIGRCAELIGCIFVTRVGKDAAASRSKTFELI